MKWEKFIRIFGKICLIVVAILVIIDIVKTLKISINFMGMQSSTRISNSSDNPKIKYEPTDYMIKNREEVLEEIKRMAINFDTQNINGKERKVEEIANIYKLENYFYDYKSYLIIKYKLLDILDKLPDLSKAIEGFSDSKLEKYFEDNKNDIEHYYGLIDVNEFIQFAKSLSFMDNKKIDLMMVHSDTIDFDYESDNLAFMVKLKAENGKSTIYNVEIQYYKITDNQVNPYMKFYIAN